MMSLQQGRLWTPAPRLFWNEARAKCTGYAFFLISDTINNRVFVLRGGKIMLDAELKKKKHKTRIATRFSNLNAVILLLVLVLMAAVAIVIIRDISEDAAIDRVRAHSQEAAQIFYSYISEDLTLARKASYSKAISEWCIDERDGAKKELAFYEMMDYTAIASDANLYLGISESNNEYSIAGTALLEDFTPIDKLNPSVIEDAWFFKSIDSENEYSLNIGIDILNDTWHLWINHKVFSNGNLSGIFCSGLRIPDVFAQTFGKTDNIRGYIINKFGVIQLASTTGGIYSEESDTRPYENHISNISSDPVFTGTIQSHLSNINTYFTPHSQSIATKLSRSIRG